MNIVVLDGFTLNPGDLNWAPLQALGQCEIYPHTADEDILARAQHAEVILTNKTVISAQTLAALPKLKYIGVLATGTNVVDVACANERGIVVTNIPGYGPDAVAQMVFAHVLHHCQRVSMHDEAVKQGQWTRHRDFCFTLAPLMSLKGKTMGVIGYGDIGQQVANIASSFGMKVLINTPKMKHNLPNGHQWCQQDELFAQADVISLHCPLTADTQQFINQQTLAQFKSGCLLINTARGDLVNEADLANWLNQNHGFAGVDVLSTEPPKADNPLLSADNISITPHIAWATLEARQNLLNIAVANLHGFQQGNVIHLV